MSAIPLVVLALVLIAIAIRKVGAVKLQIWQIMGVGALLVLVTLQITPLNALKAIDVDVMVFLACMFIVGSALEESGLLDQLFTRAFARAKNLDALVILIIFVMGFCSALLLNDTMAIMGTPVVLTLALRNRLNRKMMLLVLAFSITIGSVFSPIGNPQNLLIALDPTVEAPFVDFFKWLFVPTVLNLFLAYALIRFFYRKEFDGRKVVPARVKVKDIRLSNLCRLSLGLILVMILLKVILVTLDLGFDMRLTYIAVAGALPLLLLSRRRFEIMMKMDWRTLVFFASMFVLMKAVWNTGYFQDMIDGSGLPLLSIPVILSAGVVLSQFVSNVPLVALYLPVMTGAGARTPELMALAAGSTIAGNMFILGAASNVIIIQNAEQRGSATLTFWDFARIGVPLTIMNTLVYWAFFTIFL